MCLPSGENATDMTQDLCPSSGGRSSSPVSASQSRMVLSPDADAMHLPSGENATDVT